METDQSGLKTDIRGHDRLELARKVLQGTVPEGVHPTAALSVIGEIKFGNGGRPTRRQIRAIKMPHRPGRSG